MTREEMMNEKRLYTRKLEELFKLDKNSGVSSCEFKIVERFGAQTELVEVKLRTGEVYRICVTGDSLPVLAKDVMRKVYYA